MIGNDAGGQLQQVGVAEMDRDSAVIGNERDIAYVKSRIGHATQIYAVFRPDDETAYKAAHMQLKMFFCPCFWPFLICLGPCLCASAKTMENKYKATYYAVTSEGVYSIEDQYDVSGCTLCTKVGQDYNFLPWDQVVSVNVKYGRNCMQFSHVFIQTHGVTVTGSGDSTRVRQNGLPWLLPDCDEVAKLLRDKLQEFKQNRNSPFVMQAQAIPTELSQVQLENQTVSVEPPSGMRLFVFSSITPEEKKVVRINRNASIEEFHEEIMSVLGLKSISKLFLVNGESKVEISGVLDLDPNDTVCVQG
uniref:Ubiquitin-like domain-containing protein n=1 Tax=Mucochytrium quahogii TaxID=96639 RepID=A0A7S2RR92_9STRA|mmetsp:Transcript_20431/g.33716  ORF Transcript_20431/g.33716 Transcript_20431/m.33716 type:complete len:304 (+) Transcript_20431:46-957(+)